MHGWLRATGARRMRTTEDGLECPNVPPTWSARPPSVRRSHAVTAAIPTFSWLPENYGILHPALGEYATAVSHGPLTWGDHLTVTTIRLSLFPPPEGTHPAPSVSYPPLATTSFLAHSTRSFAHYHRWLAARLSQRCRA